MSPTTSPPGRRRKLRRRFSSVSPNASGWSHSALQTLAPAPNTLKLRRRQGSISPPATSLGIPFRAQDDDFDGDEGAFDPSESIRSAPSHRHVYHREAERSIPLLYSSLPPTPISALPSPRPFDTEPPLSPTFQSELAEAATRAAFAPPFSLWDYLREELLATDFDSHQELKWDRVSNFLSIPLAMEKVRSCLVDIYKMRHIVNKL